MGVADYDGDGWFDVFKTNFVDDTYQRHFHRVAFSSGLGINNQYVAWSCGFFDFDNDGWQDTLQVNGYVYPEIEGHDIRQDVKNPHFGLQKIMARGVSKTSRQKWALASANTFPAAAPCLATMTTTATSTFSF